ncbi:hypothetical protein CsSME_00036200 [Camellia sinensis var. sinensis]
MEDLSKQREATLEIEKEMRAAVRDRERGRRRRWRFGWRNEATSEVVGMAKRPRRWLAQESETTFEGGKWEKSLY